MNVIIFKTDEDFQSFEYNLGDGFSEEVVKDVRYTNTIQGIYSIHNNKLETLIEESFGDKAVLHFGPIFRKEGWFDEKPELACLMLNKLDDIQHVMLFTLELLETNGFLQNNPEVAEVVLDKCIDATSKNENSSAVQTIVSLFESQEGLVEINPIVAQKLLQVCQYDSTHLSIIIDRIEKAPGLLDSSKELKEDLQTFSAKMNEYVTVPKVPTSFSSMPGHLSAIAN